MSWKEKMKEWGGGDMAFLSEDGEAIMFIVVGEPVLLEGVFKGRPSNKIGCPVVTLDGFELLIVGKRLARKISKYEEQFSQQGFIAIRHGAADDPQTTYELKTIVEPEIVRQLFEVKERDFQPDMIPEAVEAAQIVMKG